MSDSVLLQEVIPFGPALLQEDVPLFQLKHFRLSRPTPARSVIFPEFVVFLSLVFGGEPLRPFDFNGLLLQDVQVLSVGPSRGTARRGRKRSASVSLGGGGVRGKPRTRLGTTTRATHRTVGQEHVHPEPSSVAESVQAAARGVDPVPPTQVVEGQQRPQPLQLRVRFLPSGVS